MANILAYGDKIVGGNTSGGGSESGGHEIVNSSGVSLPQEDKLQFTGGLKATDDSTNGRTVISDDPVEMTYAEWILLTPAQQQAIPRALITNAPGISDQFVSKSGDTMSGNLTIGTTVRGELFLKGNNPTYRGRIYNNGANALTDDRDYYLPNATGTLALTSDINKTNYMVTLSNVSTSNAVTIPDIDGNNFRGAPASLVILRTNTGMDNCASIYVASSVRITPISEGTHSRAPRLAYDTNSDTYKVTLNNDSTGRGVYVTLISLEAFTVS